MKKATWMRFLVFIVLSALIQPGFTHAQLDTENRKTVRDDWPRFLGPNFDGAAISLKEDIDWTSQPDFLWSLKVGLGYGLGVIQDDRYYHLDSSLNASEEQLKCIDMHTGKVIWTQSSPLAYRDMYGYEPGPRGCATIDQHRIYTMGVGGRLTCRELDGGDEVWAVNTNEEYSVVQNFFGVGGAPLVINDLVVVMVGGSPPADQAIAPGRLDRVSPAGSALVAFDKTTGKERWKSGDDLASYSSPRTIEVDGETLVLLFARDHLMAFDSATGKQRWQFPHRAEILESVNAMVPLVSGNHVFISECYAVGSALLKVTGKDAQVVWKDPERNRRQQAMRVHWSGPTLVDGFLYGCSGRNAPDSDFRCIEMLTGKVMWSDDRRIRASVTRAGDHLLVLEERGFLQVIRPNTKKLDVVAEWNLQLQDGERPALDYPCWAAPIVVGDKVLVRGDENVVCLRLQQK